MAEEKSLTEINSQQKEIPFAKTFIAILAVLAYGRIYFLHDVFWDDNCWLLSVYASKDIIEYLNTGWFELRRVSLGLFTYYFFSLHRSSDLFYVVGHTVNIITQIITPLFLYLFLKNVLSNRQSLAFFITASLLIYPLDFTLPVFVNINYRIGMMLIISSFYFTERALVGEKISWLFLIVSLAAASLSHYILIEATIAFEITRLFIVGYIFYKKGMTDNKKLISKSLIYWSPFFLLSIPLAIYKLLFKPYGIYSGVYKNDYFFLFNWREHTKALKWFFFEQWRILFKYIHEVNWESVLFSILAIIISILAFKKISNVIRNEIKHDLSHNHSFQEVSIAAMYSIRDVLLVGLFFLLPPLFMLEFAGRELGYTVNSYHFALLQPGYSIIFGCLLYFFYRVFSCLEIGRKILHIIVALIIGMGIFFNNLNLDLYFASWDRQMHFWQTFTNRFPAVPQNATFMIDARDFYYYDFTDLDNAYDLEPILNLLYNSSDDPKKFRKYKVFAMEEFKPEMAEKFKCNQVKGGKIERMTHFGKEALNPCEFVVVRYRDNELLVNDEIVKRYPDIPYKNWANKSFPELPKPTAYPLRKKIEGFFN